MSAPAAFVVRVVQLDGNETYLRTAGRNSGGYKLTDGPRAHKYTTAHAARRAEQRFMSTRNPRDYATDVLDYNDPERGSL
jgi:hypothetical protein